MHLAWYPSDCGASYYLDHNYFSPKDFKGIVPHEGDPMAVIVKMLNFNVRCLLIDPGSSLDVLFWEAFKGMQLYNEKLQPYHGTLVGLTGEQVQIKGRITLKTTFGSSWSTKAICVWYLVVDVDSPYNVIIGRTTLNNLGVPLSTFHLTLKYPLTTKTLES